MNEKTYIHIFKQMLVGKNQRALKPKMNLVI